MADAYSAMLDLSVQLAAKKADGGRLSTAEQIMGDIMWVDAQVCPNGFYGWLYNTSCERIKRTIPALETVGCSRVSELVRLALEVAQLDPQRMSDETRERQIDSLTEADRDRLSELDGEFYNAVEQCMEICSAFVSSHGALFQP